MAGNVADLGTEVVCTLKDLGIGAYTVLAPGMKASKVQKSLRSTIHWVVAIMGRYLHFALQVTNVVVAQRFPH